MQWRRFSTFPWAVAILALTGSGDLVASQSFDRFFSSTPPKQEGDPVGEVSIVAGLTMGWAHIDPSENSGLGDATGILGAGLPEFAFLCRSRLEPSQYMYNTLPEFRIPGIWLNNITIPMGTWTVQMGSELQCQLWECDGFRGCSYFTRGLPDAEVGDDLLGNTNIDIDDFKDVFQKDYSIGSSSEGTSAIFRLSCQTCSEYIQDNPAGLEKPPADVDESTNSEAENPAPPPNPGPEENAPAPSFQEESTELVSNSELPSSSPEESMDLSPNSDSQIDAQAPGPDNEFSDGGSDAPDQAASPDTQEDLGGSPMDVDSALEDDRGIAPGPEDGPAAEPQAAPAPLVQKFDATSSDFPKGLPLSGSGIINDSYTQLDPAPEPEPTRGAAFKLLGGRYSGIKIAGWALLFAWLVVMALFVVARQWPGIVPCYGIRSKLLRTREAGEISHTLPVSTDCSDSEANAGRSNGGHGSLNPFPQEIVLATDPEEVSRLVRKDPKGRPRNVHILSDWKPSQ
ncbi:hypothetical protein BSKO_07297 [Bryopsis sp. KO-2023]|nr:hypothetical protein BSKO_07297 [Bryopsis sp. KO-2023]